MNELRAHIVRLIAFAAVLLVFAPAPTRAQTPGVFPVECVITPAGALYCSSMGSCVAGTQPNGLPGYGCTVGGSTPIAASCSYSNLQIHCTSSSPNADCTPGWAYSFCKYTPNAYLSSNPSSINNPTGYIVGMPGWTTPIAITNVNASASVQFTTIGIQKGLADYAIVTACPASNPTCTQCTVSSTLAHGGMCYVGVQFTPQAPKTRPGNLIIAASVGGQPAGQLNISLNGVATYGLPPASVDDRNAGQGLRVRASQRLAALTRLAGSESVTETSSTVAAPSSTKEFESDGGGGDGGDGTCSDPCMCNGEPPGGGSVSDPGIVDPVDEPDPSVDVDSKRARSGPGTAAGSAVGLIAGGGRAAPPNAFGVLKAIGTELPAWTHARGTTAALETNPQRNAVHLLVGDSVNVGAANLTKTHVDHQGQYADPMVFARTYNSLLWQSASAVAQPIGPGWVSNWDQVLVVTMVQSGTSWVYQKVLVPNGDGTSYRFTPSGSTWVSSSDITATLTQVVANGIPAGWVLTKTDGTVRTFDALNRLSTLKMLTGRVYSVTYDTYSRLIAVQNQFGRSLTFAYDPKGRLTTLTDVAGGLTTYAYDSNGRLTSVTYPDGRSRGYMYEWSTYPDALTGMLDSDGTRIATYNYDSSGRPRYMQRAGGAGLTTVVYGASNVTVTDVNGAAYVKTFSANSDEVQLASTTASCSGCNTLSDSAAYDTLGELTSYTNPNGITTGYKYDALGRPTQKTQAYGTSVERKTYTVWNPLLDLPQSVQTPANKTSYFYDTNNRLVQETITGGNPSSSRTVNYTYTSNGQLATVDGARTDISDVTNYTYDPLGNVTSITDPLGHVTSYSSYNALGQPLSITYPDGTAETKVYDAVGRVLSDTSAGRTTTTTYNANGLVATTTTPEGLTTTYTYDANHQLVRVDRSSDGHIQYAWNNAGQVTSIGVYDVGGNLARSSTFTYDSFGRKTNVTDSTGYSTTFKYDSNGNPVSITDANGDRTSLTYDALNRVTTVLDPAAKSTQITYDTADRPLTVIDPNGNSTTYTYNGFEDLVAQSSPDTGIKSTTVDSAGNPVNTVDARGVSASTAFDAGNQVNQTTFSDGTSARWSFVPSGGGAGRLAMVSNGAATLNWTYDSHGRMASRSQTVGSITSTVLFTRDALGNLSAITYPSGGVLQLGYTNGVVTSLSWNGQTVVNDVQYFPFGPPESWLFGDGTEYTRYIDTNGRVSKYLVPGGSQTLTRDKSGQITGLKDDATGRVQSMTYDAVQRLKTFAGFTSATSADSRSYSYDGNGNRLSASASGTSYIYNYSPVSNRLATVSAGFRTNTYDANGNLVSDGKTTYGYAADNTLKQVIATTGTYNYGVDAMGNRVSRTDVSGAGSIWVRDNTGHMLGEYNAQTGAAIQEFIWLNDTPVAVVGSLPIQCGSPPCRQTGIGYIWTDQVETPRAVTGASGTKVWEWFSAPFGDTPPNENPSALGAFSMQLRFPGQYFDAVSGMNENGARAYDSAIGRYSQSDPIGLAAGTNTYSYVHNNPLRRVDRSGLDDSQPSECPASNQTLTPLQCRSCYRVCEHVGIGGGIVCIAAGALVATRSPSAGAIGAIACGVGVWALVANCEAKCDSQCTP